MGNHEDDLDIEDITQNLNKKKKIKSGVKGKRGERQVINDLNKRFAKLIAENPSGGGFSRTVGSGNRWGQNVNLPKHALDTFVGDIVAPINFKFVIESKKGYNDIDLFNCFTGKCRELDEFLQQATDDAGRSGKKPMLVWSKDRKDKVVFIRDEDIGEVTGIYLKYNGWTGVLFKSLLKRPDKFFFE
ncbi:MAG: hypothetical protein DWQ19_11575 [Crenarchaeota archaeon]|nr:MAG: hypothetical protein DWQ19_11575 [Thermoproteota archaeon]